VSTFTQEKFPLLQKENLTSLLGDLNNQMLESIAHSRSHLVKGSMEGNTFIERFRKLKDLVSLGPLSATEAKEHGLVDYLAYRDDVSAYLIRRPAKGLGHYLRVREFGMQCQRELCWKVVIIYCNI
jgi:hypothetical protein